ncbi:AbfB domain-containing protein [Plantactinospora sp. WMMC1484]|uniref:AbfB domain-containing protein n=1 Tax=Plantactinospora sp. WMMC1484 TaxID=3404122 RepID=UPI003BF48E73
MGTDRERSWRRVAGVARRDRWHGSGERSSSGVLLAGTTALLMLATLATVFLAQGAGQTRMEWESAPVLPDIRSSVPLDDLSFPGAPSPDPPEPDGEDPAAEVGMVSEARNPTPKPGRTTPPAPAKQPTRTTSPGRTTAPPKAEEAPKPPTLAQGARVGLEPVTRSGFRIRHARFVGRVDRIGTGSRWHDRLDATFVIRSGLADRRCVSLESVNYPGYYLRHQNFRIYLHRRDGSALFAADATFCAIPGLAGEGISLRSRNYPSRYLWHSGSELRIRTPSGAPDRAAATFTVRSPL